MFLTKMASQVQHFSEYGKAHRCIASVDTLMQWRETKGFPFFQWRETKGPIQVVLHKRNLAQLIFTVNRKEEIVSSVNNAGAVTIHRKKENKFTTHIIHKS